MKKLEKYNKLQQYYKILCKEIPEFIWEYSKTQEMQRLEDVGQFCGVDYTNLPFYQREYFYSRLDHSIAVALIIWNFTKDKKQTLAGLFHDITAPAFSHVIDYMEGDTIKQEITEQDIEELIKDSSELKRLLERDKIAIEEVSDYKKYSIADNPRPGLAADRLEGLFSAQLIWIKDWDLEKVEQIYSSIKILENEKKEKELGFCREEEAILLMNGAIHLGYLCQKNEDKVMMNLLADILRMAIEEKIITKEELYHIGEKEVIKKLEENQHTQLLWTLYQNAKMVYRSDSFKENSPYCIETMECKRMHINVLAKKEEKIERIGNLNPEIKSKIEEFLNYQDSKYAYL